jgi:type II secretory pathway predicted ATPase ExeA
MYQEHFGFNRRPFAAVPDIELFVENVANRNCLDEAIVCLEGGQGIAILTAPAGVGKTIMCHKLADCLKSPFVTILLPNSTFASQRAMLQSVLFELGRKYVRLEEQELRLELISALRSNHRRDDQVVLIVDEAEHLKPEILEEIRNLANLSENGQPLVRVILSGQPQLEERLLEPDMTALNQRVRSQLYLQPLTRSESMDYVSEQIRICGQFAELVIQEDALELMVHAADGNARCLNQLADHSLLLAYMSGERPVSLKTVREALDDLKQLPLQWNDPGTLASDSDDSMIGEDSDDPISRADVSDIAETIVATECEFEAHFDAIHDTDDGVIAFEVGGNDADAHVVVVDPGESADNTATDDAGDSNEESVSADTTIYEQTDDGTAVFEVGAGDAGQDDVLSSMIGPDATRLESTGNAAEPGDDSAADVDGVIELPSDQDSCAAYEKCEKCDPIRQEVTEAQGIASAFLDSDEFSDSYQLESPSLTQDEPELDIPLVPLGQAELQSFDSTQDDGPTLSLVDRLADESDGPDSQQADTQPRLAIEELETFAEQAVDSRTDASAQHVPEISGADEPHEEVVFDRYAWLDAGGNPADLSDDIVMATTLVDAVEEDEDVEETATEDEDAISETDEQSEAEPFEDYDVIMADPPTDELEASIAAETDDDVDLAADLLDEEREMLGLSIDDDVYDIVHPAEDEQDDSTVRFSDEIVTTVAMSAVSETTADESEPSVDEDTQQVGVMSTDEPDGEPDTDQAYANLFSRLRRLQMAAREMDDRI